MGCIYSDFEGECSLYEQGHPNNPEGCVDDSTCCAEDDPLPGDTCGAYESDWLCSECDADLNINECECEDL